ncbi:MAG: hypothetical protein NT049_06365 [Planctomycetota bacterium]|nr:hypothetical protein [Planctomycetota bacterium]
MKTTASIRGARRRAGGNALLEFLLTLPIIIFVAGLTIYMSIAMLAKQQAVAEARTNLYKWSHGAWSPMKLEGWDSSLNAPGTGGPNKPRGFGDDLDRLRPEIEPSTIAQVSNALVRDFWERSWDNLPGRYKTDSTKTFETAPMWNFIEKSASADHQRDSSAWHFDHFDLWKVARSGPLKEVFDAFRNNLQINDVAPHVKPTRDDIYRRWWHADDILGQEGQNLQAGG